MEDYHGLSLASISFSGQSTELPAILLRLRDDTVPERTEQLKIHLRLHPSELEYEILLENTTATIVILDDDSENHALYIYYVCCIVYMCVGVGLLLFFISDVTVKFEPLVYQVNESSSTSEVRLVLLGETSNAIAVTVHTVDQEAQCKLEILYLLVLPTTNVLSV